MLRGVAARRTRSPWISEPTPNEPGTLLPQSFYARDAVTVARELVGMMLRRDEIVLRITEVEAYGWPDDSACHGRAGPTARNAPMFGMPGRAYVYLCYGLHHLLNIVTQPEGEAAAVLVRACEPVAGLERIRARRGGRTAAPELLTGPGKVAAALGLDRTWNGHPVHEPGGLELLEGARPERLAVGRRIGIDYAEPRDRDAPWRFAWAGSPWVSHPSGLTPERKRGGRSKPRSG
jgi:DNA-3-methyladenine glycosylase